jgi:hypothetical protein
MSILDLDSIARVDVHRDPFCWAEVEPTFTSVAVRDALCAEFPRDGFQRVEKLDGDKRYRMHTRALVRDGVHDAAGLSPAWRALLDEVTAPSYRALVAARLDVPLADARLDLFAWTYDAGCWLDPHVDKQEKRATHIFYFNSTWSRQWGGGLELLRSASPTDVFHEIVPLAGRSFLLARSAESWHRVAPIRAGAAEAPTRRSLQIVFSDREPARP